MIIFSYDWIMLIPFMKEYTKEPPPKVDYHTVERIWMTHIGQGDSNPAPERLICAYSLTLYLPG